METQNTGKIEVWNLSKEHISVLEESNCIVSLKAGYENNLALIFAGYVSFVSTVVDGADRKTTIEVLDSLTEARNTYVAVSFAGTVNWKTIFDYVAAQIGTAIVYSYNAQFTDVSNGYSYVGPAKNVLSKGCDCCGLSWSIQNGVLQIKNQGDAISDNAYLLSAETGMLGVPEKVAIANEDDTTTNTTGYDVTYLLNGAIDVDDFVELQSETISGYFYVHSLQVTGDSIKGDWICTARLLALEKTSAGSATESAETSSTVSSLADVSFSKGDSVTVNSGAKTYNGGGLASFVYSTVYTVIQVNGDRVVIGLNGVVTAAVNASDLTKV